MKNLLNPIFALSILILSLSACTAGDKGSEQVADSVRIDTTQSATSAGASAGQAESVDSNSSDSSTIQSRTIRDSTQKDRSGNSAADYKPKK